MGVSHAAPTHHFGDKTGLLTAIATEGFGLLASALREAWKRTGSFLEVGVAYVEFATTHRGHFEVMFRPDLYRADDPELAAARAASAAVLYGGAEATTSSAARVEAGVAGWSLMHGFVSLWVNDLLPRRLGDDPAHAARRIGRHLFGGAAGSGRGRSDPTRPHQRAR